MSLIWWKVWKLRTEEVELTHILVALCNASQIHSAALEYLHNFSSQFEMTFQYYGGKWLITKGACRDQVWNACHGAVDRKVICYASPLFTCVVYHPHIMPLCFWFIPARVLASQRRSNSIREPDSYQSISCNQVPVFDILFLSFSIWSFLDRSWVRERLIWLWSVNQLKPTTSLWSPFGSIGIPLVCTLIASLWTCFEYFYAWYKITFN